MKYLNARSNIVIRTIKVLHQITTDVKECAHEALEMYKTKVQDLEEENKYLKSELEKFQQAYLRIIGC